MLFNRLHFQKENSSLNAGARKADIVVPVVMAVRVANLMAFLH
nr:MAG TPA: hypothetical protein [Caudoviricetes sp.]